MRTACGIFKILLALALPQKCIMRYKEPSQMALDLVQPRKKVIREAGPDYAWCEEYLSKHGPTLFYIFS